MTICSGKSPIVGLPLIRRGPLSFVTRPSITVPAGINCFPSTTTGSASFPWNGSPTLMLKVEIVVCNVTFNGVPSGTEGALVCAHTDTAINSVPAIANSFFITPPAACVSDSLDRAKHHQKSCLTQLLHRRHHLLQRSPIRLIVASINEPSASFRIDDQRCRMRNVQCIHPKPVIQPV